MKRMGKGIFDTTKETFSQWSQHKAPRLAAALAFYTIFALAPLLIIVIAIAGLAFGQEAAQGQIVSQIRSVVGSGAATSIQEMIAAAGRHKSGIFATVISVIILLVGAGGLFGQLQDALNTVWEVKLKPQGGILRLLKQRFISFSMVLGVAFLLLVSLVVSAGLSALGRYMSSAIPVHDVMLNITNIVISVAVITVLFALIFKVLPDAKIAWGDVWLGAFMTAILFNIGKFLIGLYLGRSTTASVYGAAGSLVIILLWVYYAAQILLLGAEFTRVYANRYGSGVKPEEGAVAIETKESEKTSAEQRQAA